MNYVIGRLSDSYGRLKCEMALRVHVNVFMYIMYHFLLAEIAFNDTLRRRIAKLFSTFFFLNKNTITFLNYIHFWRCKKVFPKKVTF